MSRRARQFVKRWTARAPRLAPEIVFSPNLGALVPRLPAALLPPVIHADSWRDFTDSLYPLLFMIGRQLSEGTQ